MAELGCATDYEVVVTDRGTRQVADLPFTALTWQRRRDALSDCRVTVPTSGRDCCGDVSDLRTWRHELLVLRDGQRVWEGPIVDLIYNRSSLQIVAHDSLAWLARRAIRSRLCFSSECAGVGRDVALIARDVIRHALAPDDPELTLTMRSTGITVERVFEAHSAYALDVLGELARNGLRFTAVGRRVVLFGSNLGGTPTLDCSHFRTDISVVEPGLSVATRAFVRGQSAVGEAGGVDGFFGLVEQIVQDDLVRSQAQADQAAAFAADALAPPGLLVLVPPGAALSPTAPVTIDQLVPGVGVPVSVDCVCRDVTQTLQLVGIDVSVVGGETGGSGEGETVGVFLAPEVSGD